MASKWWVSFIIGENNIFVCRPSLFFAIHDHPGLIQECSSHICHIPMTIYPLLTVCNHEFILSYSFWRDDLHINVMPMNIY